MRRTLVRVAWASLVATSLSAVAHAQCTKDTDCKGDRVCEAGKCTSPALPPAPPAPPGTDGAAPAPAGTEGEAAAPASEPAPAAPAGAPVVAIDREPREAPPAAMAPLGADEPQYRRRNRGMMIGGIVMVSTGPIMLLVALSSRNSQEECDRRLETQYPDHKVPLFDQAKVERCDDYSLPIYLFGIGGAVLTAAGIPLIIYGGKNERVPNNNGGGQARLLPWAGPGTAGLRLRIDM